MGETLEILIGLCFVTASVTIGNLIAWYRATRPQGSEPEEEK